LSEIVVCLDGITDVTLSGRLAITFDFARHQEYVNKSPNTLV